jgi:hypothetical protein
MEWVAGTTTCWLGKLDPEPAIEIQRTTEITGDDIDLI